MFELGGHCPAQLIARAEWHEPVGGHAILLLAAAAASQYFWARRGVT
eukprot:COSAG01_NODE_24_length_37608_cov_19.303154_35_plen_47_part_00